MPRARSGNLLEVLRAKLDSSAKPASVSLADLVEVYAVRSALDAVDWTASLPADLKRELDRVSDEIVAFEGAALLVADVAQVFAESPRIPPSFREAALEQVRSAATSLGALFEQPGFASEGLFGQRLTIHRATPFDSAGAFALALLAARDQSGPVATVPTGLPPLEGLLSDFRLEAAVHALQLGSMAKANRLLDGIQQVIQQGTGADAAPTSPQSKLVAMAVTATEKNLLGALKSKHAPMDFLNTLVLWTLARGYEAVQRMRSSPQLSFFVANTSTEILLYETTAYLLGSAWARVKIEISRADSPPPAPARAATDAPLATDPEARKQVGRSPAQKRIASVIHAFGSAWARLTKGVSRSGSQSEQIERSPAQEVERVRAKFADLAPIVFARYDAAQEVERVRAKFAKYHEQINRSPAQERIVSVIHVLGSFFETNGGLEMADRLFLPQCVGYLVNREPGHALAMFCEVLQANVTRTTLAEPVSGYRSKGTILERTEPLRIKVEGALGPDFAEAFAATAAMLARGEIPEIATLL